MLKLNWIEIFLRCIPEMMIVIWGIYIIAGKSFNKLNYIILSIAMGLYGFLVRELPIYFGVHTMIITISLISILIIEGIPLFTAICSTLSMLLLLIISESLNKLLLYPFNIGPICHMPPLKKFMFTFPSLILMVLFILILKHLIKNKSR